MKSLPDPGGSARGRALHEPPAVVLEVLPVPVGLDDFQHGLHLGGGLGDLGLQADDLLFRLVALDVAFQGDLAADGLDGHGVVLFGHGAVEDRLQTLDGRLRQALLHGLVDFLPLGIPFIRFSAAGAIWGAIKTALSSKVAERVLIDGFLAEWVFWGATPGLRVRRGAFRGQ